MASVGVGRGEGRRPARARRRGWAGPSRARCSGRQKWATAHGQPGRRLHGLGRDARRGRAGAGRRAAAGSKAVRWVARWVFFHSTNGWLPADTALELQVGERRAPASRAARSTKSRIFSQPARAASSPAGAGQRPEHALQPGQRADLLGASRSAPPRRCAGSRALTFLGGRDRAARRGAAACPGRPGAGSARRPGSSGPGRWAAAGRSGRCARRRSGRDRCR